MRTEEKRDREREKEKRQRKKNTKIIYRRKKDEKGGEEEKNEREREREQVDAWLVYVHTFSYLCHGQYLIHQSSSFISFEMSIVVKTLTCGSLSNGNSSSSNANTIKPVHIRQNNTGAVMSSKKLKVSL